jgi:hypothetical protein
MTTGAAPATVDEQGRYLSPLEFQATAPRRGKAIQDNHFAR